MLRRQAMKKTKRPMILLEVLIAIALIGLCSGVFFGTPAKVYQRQIKAIKELELARASSTIFIKLLPELKKNHKWEDVTRKKDTFFPVGEKVHISYSPLMKGCYDAAYRIKVRKEKEGENDTTYRLLEVELFFKEEGDTRDFTKVHNDKKYKNLHFTYNTFVSKAPKKRYTS
ncbi:MAG: hypothetical protein S4CHLAM37_01640 [Chlamydiia bacterium]|nr:hypothetical protein [Chlamydiia bacterium]